MPKERIAAPDVAFAHVERTSRRLRSEQIVRSFLFVDLLNWNAWAPTNKNVKNGRIVFIIM